MTPIVVKNSQIFSSVVTNIFDNETKIIKAVTSRGTATTLLYAPSSEVPPEQGLPPGSGSNSTDQFTITVFKFNDSNINGKFDTGELPIGGWRFTIKNALTGLQVPSPTPPFLNTNALRLLHLHKPEQGILPD
jgi:hypothetical protein